VAGAPRFAVGIDLGTTNTVVAWAPLDGAGDGRVGAAKGAEGGAFSERSLACSRSDAIGVLEISQMVAPGERGSRPLFPSALYAPLREETPSSAEADPFGDAPWVLGEHARRRAAEVPGRVVVSSKSWLAYAGVDRTAEILPWSAVEGVPKISPVDAAARILAHVHRAWDAAHPGAPLAQQDVVLTVPASFDEVGRELTIDAAARAGLAPKLLEEPQAAFYDWMTRAGREGLERLLAATGGEALALVIDVGGGTTDLSLVRVSGVDDVARVAVGPHLLLGGDNMDIALAHACEGRLTDGGAKLDAPRFAQLVGACRAAKETLLEKDAPEEAPVTVAGSGASLVGGTRSTRLGRAEVEGVVLDGFFPVVPAEARPMGARGGLLALGLPYERDPAITRHVAAFLAKHTPSARSPDAVLFNGGVFRAARIAERMMGALSGWHGGASVQALGGTDPDLAVARGAVAYALARRGQGVRIGGGTGRAYFVGVAGEFGAKSAVCVVPRGAEEGTSHTAEARVLALAVGRPVRFDLWTSDTAVARAGDVVRVDDEAFTALPPLATTIAAEGRSGRGEVRVSLEGELTPVGTLDLACVEVGDGAGPARTERRRFRLAFQLREGEAGPPAASVRPRSTPARSLEAAIDLVDRAFGKPRADAGGREAKDLLRELERMLGERTQWTMDINRALCDALLARARTRRRSADHERVFWMIAGWGIRPGIGDALDPGRIAEMVPLFDERLAFPAEARGWQQFFIAWRRAAAGLDENVQAKIRDFADDHLAPPGSGRKRPKKAALSLDDALDMASSLERVAPGRRAELGGWVLERTWTDRDPRLWSALGRLGGRVPAYASVHHVVAPHVAERWLDHLLREKWDAVPTAGQAATQLARRTGDRARDVSDALRTEVARRLAAIGADEAWIQAVREVVPVAERDRVAFFGDALPLGLRLVE
jgi:molecular chaperone DnaK (HSP70)